VDEKHRLLIQKAGYLSAFVHFAAIVGPFNEGEEPNEQLASPTAELDYLDLSFHVRLSGQQFRKNL